MTPEQLELHLEIFQLEFELEALYEWVGLPTMSQAKIQEFIKIRTEKLGAACMRLTTLSEHTDQQSHV